MMFGSKGGGKGGGGGGGSRQATEAPNTLRSVAIARVLDVVSEGEIEGLVDGAKSIYFDDTPLQNADGTYNFNGVNWAERVGLTDQEIMQGFSAAEQQTSVDVFVETSAPTVRRITNTLADDVRVQIRIPALTTRNKSNGDTTGGTVQFAIEFRAVGQTDYLFHNEDIGIITITGKTVSPYEVDYRFPLIDPLDVDAQDFDLRVRRITPDTEDQAIQNKTYWVGFVEIINEKFIYPDTAYIGFELDGELFGGQIPKRSYRVKGRKIRVPSNYNPETREYSGFWDGSFKIAWSNNPAWVYYDLVTSNRYGLGDRIDDAQISIGTLYEIAKYCDELVSNGRGGLEPRFTINVVLNTPEDAYSLLQSLASNFRSISYWGSGAVMLVQDSPRDVDAVVVRGNVIEGRFDYEGSGDKARHNSIRVTWNDPADFYKAHIEIVEDNADISRRGLRRSDVYAFGCTSQGQAHRFGRWILYTEKYESEKVQYSASFDHAQVYPGMLVSIQDPAYSGADFGGRYKQLISSSITLDRKVELAAGQSYELNLMDKNLNVVSVQVLSQPSTTDVLIFSPSINFLDFVVGGVWSLTGTDVEPRVFRVLANAEVEPNQFQITAIAYHAGKYDLVENGIALEENTYNRFTSGTVPTPQNLSLSSIAFDALGNDYNRIDVDWLLMRDPRVIAYELSYREQGTGTWKVITTTESNLSINNVIDGKVYEFSLVALSLFGTRSEATTESILYLSSADISAATYSIPADVFNFGCNVIGDTAYLSWAKVQSFGLSHYEIRVSVLPAAGQVKTWEDGKYLTEISASTETASLPAVAGVYMIKAVNHSGKQSAAMSSIISNAATAINHKPVLTADLLAAGSDADTAFDGTFFFGGNSPYVSLKGSDDVDSWPDVFEIVDIIYGVSGLLPEGEYLPSSLIDLEKIFTVRVSTDLVVSSYSLSASVADWEDVSLVEDVSGAIDGVARVQVYVKQSDDNVNWSSWSLLGAFADYTTRYLKFKIRLLTDDKGVAPYLEQALINVAVPDRVESNNDLIIPSTGLDVVYQNAFKEPPAVGITVEQLVGNWTHEVTNKTTEGFNIKLKEDGVYAVGKIDWIAHGFGHGQVII